MTDRESTENSLCPKDCGEERRDVSYERERVERK